MIRIHQGTSLKFKNLFTSNYRLYNTNNKLGVLFFGTDDFASAHFKALIHEKNRQDSCIASIDLVCPPDRKTGRKLETITPSETKGIAESNQLPVFHTPASATTLDNWQLPSDKQYDLGVVVSFGYFIPPHIISRFKYGAINVHPSLLPKYRGAAPIQHAIMYGDAETGVSVQELDPHAFDAGRILAQNTVSLREKLPIYSELKQKLAKIGSKLLVDTVCHLEYKKQHATAQDISKITSAHKIKKQWSELDFANMQAWQAEQLHRAIGEHYPLRTIYKIPTKKPKDITVQLLTLYLPSHKVLGAGDAPGTFAWDEKTKSLQVVFGDGSVVACGHIKVENKGTISAMDFANGYQVRGKFGVDLGGDDLVIEKNIKKRAKMHRYDTSLNKPN